LKISELFGKSKTVFSIEVFPPKKDAQTDLARSVLEEIAAVKPDYISVTCGAGGSGSNATSEIAAFIKNNCSVETMAHLTCVNLTKTEAKAALEELTSLGIENILALRGDINPSVPRKNDFAYASDLTRYIKEYGDFGVSGACYPEGHIEAASLDEDIKHLKTKAEAGAQTLVTQLFFDNALFYSFLEKIRAAGINIPVSAGIMPVTGKKQIERMVSMCGASLPQKFVKMIARYENNPEALRDAGLAYATEQIIDLISNGAEGIHFYAMNNAYAARKISGNIAGLL